MVLSMDMLFQTSFEDFVTFVNSIHLFICISSPIA